MGSKTEFRFPAGAVKRFFFIFSAAMSRWALGFSQPPPIQRVLEAVVSNVYEIVVLLDSVTNSMVTQPVKKFPAFFFGNENFITVF
jgi:hypothetical protein